MTQMQVFEDTCPEGLLCELYTYGVSHEGNDLKAIRVRELVAFDNNFVVDLQFITHKFILLFSLYSEDKLKHILIY